MSNAVTRKVRGVVDEFPEMEPGTAEVCRATPKGLLTAFQPASVWRVNDQPCITVLDSGASICFLRRSLIDKLGLRPIGMAGVSSFGGTEDDVLAFRVDLRSPDGSVYKSELALSHDIEGAHADLIVGCSVLSQGLFLLGRNIHNAPAFVFIGKDRMTSDALGRAQVQLCEKVTADLTPLLGEVRAVGEAS